MRQKEYPLVYGSSVKAWLFCWIWYLFCTKKSVHFFGLNNNTFLVLITIQYWILYDVPQQWAQLGDQK